MSKQRELIKKIIYSSDGHLSAEHIYRAARQEMPSIALATVYNNLNALCRDNIIRRLSFDSGADLFDKNTEPHEHLICSRCGAIRDVRISGLEQELQRNLGFNIEGYDLSIRYCCSDCLAAKNTDTH